MGLNLTNPGGNLPTASNSAPTKRSRKSSSIQSTPTSNPKQKRGRIDSEHARQVGTKRAEEAGPSTAVSYARAVTTSYQKLVITRKGLKGVPMKDSDLRVIQWTINRIILKSKLDFSVRIEKTFIHTVRVLMICYDEKSLKWAQEVARAIATTSMDYRRYEARGPKDAVKTETFGIWILDTEGLNIKNALELVDRCNPQIHL